MEGEGQKAGADILLESRSGHKLTPRAASGCASGCASGGRAEAGAGAGAGGTTNRGLVRAGPKDCG